MKANRNKIFIIVVGILDFLTVFFLFSFFAKYKASTFESNFKQYRNLSNSSVPVDVMQKALKADVLDHIENKKSEVKFATIISLLAAKYYGNWNEYKGKDMENIVNRLKKGEKEKDIASIYSSYTYFRNFYYSLFSEFVGSYKISDEINNEEEKPVFKEKYGLKVYSPIAYGFGTSFCDDFYDEVNLTKKGGHFGNDIAVKKGVPFVAVESGIIEKCEKDEDGTAKLELKSFDSKRKYCYYNCCKEKPFAEGIKKGSVVFAGQILGYVGAGNFCKKTGSKILRCPYLHFAIKIKPYEDLKNKEKSREIYINSLNILKFLEQNKSYILRKGSNFSQKYMLKES